MMDVVDAAETRRSGLRYWLVIAVLALFGLLTIFSIGLYIWFIAAALIVLAPFRSRPNVFIPGLALFLGFLFGYVLVAPWSCSQSFSQNPETGVEVASEEVCVSPTGVEYSGPAPFDPDRTQALITGIVAGVFSATGTWLVLRSRSYDGGDNR